MGQVPSLDNLSGQQNLSIKFLYQKIKWTKYKYSMDNI